MDLFNQLNDEEKNNELRSQVNGVDLIGAFIDDNTEEQLVSFIDTQEWITELKRRVQHYGYRYDYKARKIDPSLKAKQIPEVFLSLCAPLIQTGVIDSLPDQVVINEYLPGQGISSHIDCKPCFKDAIISLSLLSSCVMDFSLPSNTEKVSLLLNSRDLLIMTKEARSEWKHGIPARKKDNFNNKVFHRGRRISITFRQVIIS